MAESKPDNLNADREQEHSFGAAKVVAGLTMVSRVLGFVRDLVLLQLGKSVIADTFWTAFGIPHMFRRLFGEGALSAAFLPVFTEAAEESGWPRAKKVLANTAGLLAVVLTVLVAITEVSLAIWLVLGDQGPAGLADKQRLTIQFTMIMLPFTIFICLLALCSSALNARGHFAYPAAAPILLNIGLICTAVFVAPAISHSRVPQFRVIGAGLVVSSIGQLAGALWLLKRNGILMKWNLRPILPEIRQIAKRMAPTVLPLGLVQLGDQLMRFIALALTKTEAAPWLPLEPGVVRGQYLAERLYQLPLGVLAISIATVVFPLMSRCSARGDLQACATRSIVPCGFACSWPSRRAWRLSSWPSRPSCSSSAATSPRRTLRSPPACSGCTAWACPRISARTSCCGRSSRGRTRERPCTRQPSRRSLAWCSCTWESTRR